MRATLLLTAALLAASAFAAAPAATGGAVDATRLVVGHYEMPDVQAGDTYLGARVLRVDASLGMVVLLATDPTRVHAEGARLDAVRYIEPDGVAFATYTPNDPRYAEQHGPQNVKAPQAWDTTLGGANAKVCVVDSGTRYTHEDLGGYAGGYDVVNQDDDPIGDTHTGHGTHVAGIAAARTDNGLGIAGAAQVPYYAVQVLTVTSGAMSDVASGVMWCADHAGPRTVITMSLGGPTPHPALEDAVKHAYYTKKHLVVASAGNEGRNLGVPCPTDCILYPAKYAEVIAVTCVDHLNVRCGFSSSGPAAEITAPGKSILSTGPGDLDYQTLSGTSMSAPHVSGVAALVWDHVPTLSNTYLRSCLREGAFPLGSVGWDPYYGYGLLDAKETLDRAVARSCSGVLAATA